jgi:hypothetical protein
MGAPAGEENVFKNSLTGPTLSEMSGSALLDMSFGGPNSTSPFRMKLSF